MNPRFWSGCRVLLTGHTGFKGAWIGAILSRAGATLYGLALEPEQKPALSELLAGRFPISSEIIDLRDSAAVSEMVRRVQPQVVIHMGAQAQVRRGYADPVETYATNVLGTLHLLEALRGLSGLDVVLVVTSDKVYHNAEHGRPFKEDDVLGGGDPYSASKAATEVLVQSHRESFFSDGRARLATARGGNVVGGGDWSEDRLVPDIYRAVFNDEALLLRYPGARRPWQHVLDCCHGYLRYIEYLSGRPSADPPSLNFGPRTGEGATVSELADAMLNALGGNIRWRQSPGTLLPEKQNLELDSRLAERTLGWSPRLNQSETIAWTASWYRSFAEGRNAADLVDEQISLYQQLASD
jgi:CDP-glucose 4,6-dehydratase